MPGGKASRIRWRYASACSVAVTAGRRLGMTSARAKRAAVNGSTARIALAVAQVQMQIVGPANA